MSTIKTNNVQVGQSGTPSQNFTLRAPLDGTLRISRGNSGSPLSDPLVINADNSVAVAGLNGGQLAGLRNKIINGDMAISQRGTSFPAIAHQAYSLDRWQFINTTTAVSTVEYNINVPPSNEFQRSYLLTVTTADASMAAGDACQIMQRVEGYNARDLIGRTFTVSFWVRSSKVGVHCVGITNRLFDRSYVLEYTVNVANTWEYKSMAVVGGLITAGGWEWTNEIGLVLRFALAAGTNTQTTPGAWQTGNFSATAAQVNALDTVGNVFGVTGVQLEVGTVATPFEHRPFGMELALCQRYYFTAFVDGPVTGLTNGFSRGFSFPTTMRATPTFSTTITNANFGSPVGANQWGLRIEGVTEATKTGTVTIGGGASVTQGWLLGYGATFSTSTNIMASTGLGNAVSFSAEL